MYCKWENCCPINWKRVTSLTCCVCYLLLHSVTRHLAHMVGLMHVVITIVAINIRYFGDCCILECDSVVSWIFYQRFAETCCLPCAGYKVQPVGLSASLINVS